MGSWSGLGMAAGDDRDRPSADLDGGRVGGAVDAEGEPRDDRRA